MPDGVNCVRTPTGRGLSPMLTTAALPTANMMATPTLISVFGASHVRRTAPAPPSPPARLAAADAYPPDPPPPRVLPTFCVLATVTPTPPSPPPDAVPVPAVLPFAESPPFPVDPAPPPPAPDSGVATTPVDPEPPRNMVVPTHPVEEPVAP